MNGTLANLMTKNRSGMHVAYLVAALAVFRHAIELVPKFDMLEQ